MRKIKGGIVRKVNFIIFRVLLIGKLIVWNINWKLLIRKLIKLLIYFFRGKV